MTARRPPRLLIAVLFCSIASAAAFAGSEFFSEPSWQIVPVETVRLRLEEYLRESQLPIAKQAAVRESWQASATEGGEADTLDRLAQCLAKADDRVADLVEFCSQPFELSAKLPEFDWLADSESPILVRHNLRIYLARWLVQHGYYDETLTWTDGLETEDVLVPESLLFYRAVAFHQLVRPVQAEAALAQLMQQQDRIPLRYQKLADLMQRDLAALKDESLDHIARRMNDVRRRLDLGRTGERVQVVEKGVIESLDKLIKQLEDEAQKQCQMAASAGQSQPSSPMQESQIAELKGPGKVDRKNIGKSAGWGNLSDKEREKALQDIGREFPSHYREVIEEYFRRLAAEESSRSE